MRIPLLIIAVGLCVAAGSAATAQEYVGSDRCIACHNSFHADLVASYLASGHPYKLNRVEGAPPTYPSHIPGVPSTPPGTTWNDFVYVVGGYGWKARFVKPDGLVYTEGDSAQFNMHAARFEEELGAPEKFWVAYNKGQNTRYDYTCFRCHTTGASEEGSWNGVEADALGTFSEPGIRCEACHGPGGDHAANPGIKPPIQGDDLRINRCGDCHQRGGATNAIPARNGYIRHHEQVNEMRASRHGDGVGAELTCATCHNPHASTLFPESASGGLTGISKTCQTCHTSQQVLINGTPKAISCESCHMPKASRSALGITVGNGFRGDVSTHIWAIDTRPFPRDSMFEGGFVKLDDEGLAAVTLDFACLGCHTDQTLVWASGYATNIHGKDLAVSTEKEGLPAAYRLDQNYPNPFNPTTTIAFSLPESADVRVSVYSVNGQLMATLLNNRMPAGNHSVTLDARFFASGVYIYQVEAGAFVASKTMTLLK